MGGVGGCLLLIVLCSIHPCISVYVCIVYNGVIVCIVHN